MHEIESQKVNNYRYERKFYIDNLDRDSVIKVIKLHPVFFTEIYSERQVNNIYFDLHNLKHYWDNINGVSKRQKLRVRWYGNCFGQVSNPVLEIKIKNNALGGKLRYSLGEFFLREKLDRDLLKSLLKNALVSDILKEDASAHFPSLLNSYSRRYFLSNCKKFRVTVDYNLKFYDLQKSTANIQNGLVNDSAVIVEVKYQEEDDNDAARITQCFPFRLTKSSKYVQGLDNFV